MGGGRNEHLAHLRWLMSPAKLETTPSIRDGLGLDYVRNTTHRAFVLVEAFCVELRLPPLVTNTAMLLFQRFYTSQSLKVYPWRRVVAVATFAALKIEV